MRIETIEVYQFSELSDAAKEKARDWFRNDTREDSYPLDEIVDSLKGLFKAASVRLLDCQLGAYTYNSHVKFDLGDAGDLTGKRAISWLENNLFAPLRMTREKYLANRKAYFGYGDAYRPGNVPPCPFTGVCYDDDLIDDLRKSVRDGMSLNDAFHALADTVGRLVDAEYEARDKADYIDDMMIANNYEFTADGERYA